MISFELRAGNVEGVISPSSGAHKSAWRSLGDLGDRFRAKSGPLIHRSKKYRYPQQHQPLTANFKISPIRISPFGVYLQIG